MFKAMILLGRREDLTREEFRAWWLGRHQELAKGLPGVRAIRFNVVENEDADVDGIAELWFDSREAFDAAYATEHGQSVAADSLAHLSRRERLFVDEHVLLDG